MKVAPVVHGSFTITRTFNASVERAFAAWADPEWKARWFVGPSTWKPIQRKMEFKVGGQEIVEGDFGTATSLFVARYHVIVPNQLIIYDYDMHHSGRYLSLSIATVEFEPTKNGGSKMTFTEQGAFLDAEFGIESRKQGTEGLLEQLANVLA